MAEAVAAPPEGAIAQDKGGSKKKLVLGLVVLLAGGAAAWFLVLAPSGTEDGSEAAGPMYAAEPGEVVQVAETTVSLGGDPPRFAMITYSAVLSSDVTREMVAGDLPRMRSHAQVVFRGFEADELDSEAGFLRLQDSLTATAQELWPDGEVVEVLVESLLVQ